MLKKPSNSYYFYSNFLSFNNKLSNNKKVKIDLIKFIKSIKSTNSTKSINKILIPKIHLKFRSLKQINFSIIKSFYDPFTTNIYNNKK